MGGVQSFQPALLEALGRRHSREQILRAHERVRAAGFASVNLDLMFALPGQADEAWEADLDEALAGLVALVVGRRRLLAPRLQILSPFYS